MEKNMSNNDPNLETYVAMEELYTMRKKHYKLKWKYEKWEHDSKYKEFIAESDKWIFRIFKDPHCMFNCLNIHDISYSLLANYDYKGSATIFVGTLKECKNRAQELVNKAERF